MGAGNRARLLKSITTRRAPAFVRSIRKDAAGTATKAAVATNVPVSSRATVLIRPAPSNPTNALACNFFVTTDDEAFARLATFGVVLVLLDVVRLDLVFDVVRLDFVLAIGVFLFMA